MHAPAAAGAALAGRGIAMRFLAAAVAALAGALPWGAAGSPDPTAGLSLRQLVGQRLVVSFEGTRVPEALRRRISRGELAGVILFGGNIASRSSVRALVRELQHIRRPPGLRSPLLVMVDQEGGRVKRLPGAPLRSPAELGRAGSRQLLRRSGRATAKNLRGVGVNVNLAPVVDLGLPGGVQRRLGRTYAARPGLVAALGGAFVRGLEEGGVAATLKHFPGLGRVRSDADRLVQRVPVSLGRLRRADERPFAAGIRAGASLVMTGNAIYPSLSRRPALLSRQVVTGELRRRLGFRGVAITDALDTRALEPYGSPAQLARASVRAGNDLLLIGSRSGAIAFRALLASARKGLLARSGLRASARRVLRLRASLG
jgi:beta-N-acetylhexosaminidase